MYLASVVKYTCLDSSLLGTIIANIQRSNNRTFEAEALAFREWCELCAAQELLRTCEVPLA